MTRFECYGLCRRFRSQGLKFQNMNISVFGFCYPFKYPKFYKRLDKILFCEWKSKWSKHLKSLAIFVSYIGYIGILISMTIEKPTAFTSFIRIRYQYSVILTEFGGVCFFCVSLFIRTNR